MNAAPPLRLYRVLVASLVLLTAQLGLRALGPGPLQFYLVVGAVSAFAALLVVTYVTLSAKKFSVVGSGLQVRYWWQSERSSVEHPLSALSSVGYAQTRLFSRPVVTVGFASGSVVQLPVRYEGGPELCRFLFGQLGRNVEANREL